MIRVTKSSEYMQISSSMNVERVQLSAFHCLSGSQLYNCLPLTCCHGSCLRCGSLMLPWRPSPWFQQEVHRCWRWDGLNVPFFCWYLPNGILIIRRFPSTPYFRGDQSILDDSKYTRFYNRIRFDLILKIIYNHKEQQEQKLDFSKIISIETTNAKSSQWPE